MTRKVLVVDDNHMNRELLCHIIRNEYETIQAKGGVEALEILEKRGKDISAILLDILMPGMDGYEVLQQVRSNPEISAIPIIVTTANTEEGAEVKALSLGANDYIMKPYNDAVIRHRLHNTIQLRETAAQINAARRDKLTGLLNRETFFEEAEKLIAQHEAGYYIISCFDIDNFKVVNDQYGSRKGDQVLKAVANVIKKTIDGINGISCRIMADVYAMLYPSEYVNTDTIKNICKNAAVVGCSDRTLTFTIGRYLIDDLLLSVSSMYDRASMAAESIKGLYDAQVAQYDESMREKLLNEQEIIGEMNQALNSGQFEVWLQPQYNHSTKALIGAEALVRWNHPQKGLIAPGRFISIFEQNGFIYSLDKYVWEQTCMLLRRWMDEGRKVLPVSVNISRYDVFREDLADVLMGLVDKYRIPVELLRLEITESAFALSARQIISVTRNLMIYGFVIEIDDFGSGYSSLNTLKDVPANILKLDMRFLDSSDNTSRGGNILESIVRMAKWLGMSVIAEGVEEREQADYLKSIGCDYVQGYLYGKPMMIADYEDLELTAQKEENSLQLQSVETMAGSEFWDPKSMDTLIFNSYVGSACIFEYTGCDIEVLRMNDKYVSVLGGAGCTMDEAFAISWRNYIAEEDWNQFRGTLMKAIRIRDEVNCDLVFHNLLNDKKDMYFRTNMRVIAKVGERYLFYCVLENMTVQYEAEKRERKATEQIQNMIKIQEDMMNDIPGGFMRVQLMPDHTYHADYINYGFCRMLGMTLCEIKKHYGTNPLDAVHPEDVEVVEHVLNNIITMGEGKSSAYRLRGSDGEYIWVMLFGRLTVGRKGERFLNLYFTDVTERSRDISSLQEMLPVALSAVMDATSGISFIKDRNGRYLCCSRTMARVVGMEPNELVGKTDYDIINRELADRYRETDQRVMQTGRPDLDFVECIPEKAGGSIYANTSKYPLLDSFGNVVGIYGMGMSITERNSSNAQLRLLTDMLPSGLAIYEFDETQIRLSYFNNSFYEMSGYTREEYSLYTAKDPLFHVYEEDANQIRQQVKKAKRLNESLDLTYRIRTKSGECRWQNLKGQITKGISNTTIANVVMFDITKYKELEEKLRMSEEQYRLALKHSGNLICRYHVKDRVITMTKEVARVFQLPTQLSNIPYNPTAVSNVSQASLESYIRLHEDIVSGSKAGSAAFEVRTVKGWRWMMATYSTVFSEVGKPVYAVISYEDITAQRKKDFEQKVYQESTRILQKRAELDGITGIYNKAATETMIRQRMSSSNSGCSCAMVIVDLDNLKGINDTIGHIQGDRAIRQIADTLKAQFRKNDIVGRTGGDEFTVFLDGISDDNRLRAMMKALLQNISGLSIGENSDVAISVSVGVTIGKIGIDTFEKLYWRADQALYCSKRNGKKQFTIYGQKTSDQTRESNSVSQQA